VLNYFKTSIGIQVKISRDLNSVVFVSPEENFIYFKDTEIQQSLTMLRGKEIKRIINDKDNKSHFYLIASKKYDSELSIFHTHKKNFLINIERIILPGQTDLFDFVLQDSQENNASKSVVNIYSKKIYLASTINDKFYFDIISYNESSGWNGLALKFNNSTYLKGVKQKTYKLDALSAFYISWPYVCFSNYHSNHLMIFSAWQRQFLYNIEVPISKAEN
jgi:hypothetical protein